MLTVCRPSKASHFVELGICELIVRITTHANWKFFGLEAASGEVWQVVRKTLVSADDHLTMACVVANRRRRERRHAMVRRSLLRTSM